MSDKKYISYFQSVITIGILSNGENASEAASKASKKLLSKDGVNHCVFDQTNFKLSETEEWNPEFEVEDASKDGLQFRFNPDDQTRNIIATRMQKQADELTEEDCERFVKEAIESSLHVTN